MPTEKEKIYKEMPDSLNFPEIEARILEFWQVNNIFQRSVEERDPKRTFVFFEGPPTANGKPGIHHVISRTVKDSICRFKTMQGYRVERKAGWDTHGLPVEIEVEKSLGIDGKDQVLAYGIAKFNAACKKSVWSYKKEWDELTKRIGFWVDLDNPYITYTNEYIESVWWIIKQFWQQNLVYQGFKILPYCPHCETPLSSHEVSQGYEEVKDPSVYVKIKLKNEENTFFLVWTTTPWTLISNVALALNKDVEYVKIKHREQFLILAKDRMLVIDGDYEVIQGYMGKDLVNIDYEPLFDFTHPDKKAFFTVLGDFVTTTDGSGIVHIAPAFGEDDYQIGLKYDLPLVQPVDKSGRFTSEVINWAGAFVKDADKDIIRELKLRGVLYLSEPVVHSYPHCWRCKSPLLYYARKSWYIKTTAFKEKLVENNKKIAWYPREVGEGRFGEWLDNNIDWSLSRDRFWGTPLPIWICDTCNHQECIGSVQELKLKAPALSDDLDLHKPYIDEVIYPCEKCNGMMRRVPEVIDCWFDSGAMPYAQWHYPFENKEKFAKNFPADFISEGVDQTRGWFYSLLVISTFISDQPAYKTCLSLELVLDKEGQKMSKSRGTAVDPWKFLNQQGADALRWYLLTVSPPWLPKRFDSEGVGETSRKFFGTLINSYSFFTIYANIDKFKYDDNQIIAISDRPQIDRWICSLLFSLIRTVHDNLGRFDLTRAARSISSFVIDDLSNWYVRRSRRRFWKSEMGADKLAAFQTLYECLMTVSKLMAPFAPFISEEIYQSLIVGADKHFLSVHLCTYPEPDSELTNYIDETLERKMDLVRRIVFLGRSLRNEANLKVRQPLSQIMVLLQNKNQQALINDMKDLILDELNIKEIIYVSNEDVLLVKKAEPIFKNLGPKFGKTIQQAADIIRAFTSQEIAHCIKNGNTHIVIDGHETKIDLDDIKIITEHRPGLVVNSEGDLIIGLKTEITSDLLYEGLAREFINRVQNMRKEAGFNVTDRIQISVKGWPDMLDAIEKQSDYIKNETLCERLKIAQVDGSYIKEWKVGSEMIEIGISKQ
jgi:isoleucyl-tRNA synthetase